MGKIIGEDGEGDQRTGDEELNEIGLKEVGIDNANLISNKILAPKAKESHNNYNNSSEEEFVISEND